MQLKSEDIDFEGFQLKAEIVEKMLKVSREAQSRRYCTIVVRSKIVPHITWTL